MEIKITFSGDNTGFEFIEDGKNLDYGDLSREEQIMVCNALAGGYNLFSHFIKVSNRKRS